MTRVVISTVRLLEFLEGAGHFWVYMQYAHALRRLGCDVYVLDSYTWSNEEADAARRHEFLDRMARYGLEDRVVVAAANGSADAQARSFVEEADLLLNFNYHLRQDLVAAARRSALVDIDPGLLQFWISRGFIAPAAHDLYFTIGETVGAKSSQIPDCGLGWVRIRPPVSLDLWPPAYDPEAEAFTTVSTWWGERDYVGDRDDYYDNTKRTAFFDLIDLPRETEQPLEVALFFAESDESDRKALQSHGWRVRHSRDVAGSPEQYRAYVQQSRGEFSWAKPSCIRFQNAWISDRSLCYLASGKPAVVQHTGPSSFLPDAEGIFRFRTHADAVNAFDVINGDYERQSRLARKIAEEYFDADVVVSGMLEHVL